METQDRDESESLISYVSGTALETRNKGGTASLEAVPRATPSLHISTSV